MLIGENALSVNSMTILKIWLFMGPTSTIEIVIINIIVNIQKGGIMLPKWKSHKIVEGDRIVAIKDVGVANRTGPNDSGERWVLACGEVIEVSLDLKIRPAGQNPLGGYYVRYADNFESWSPSEAFEAGNTRIE
jgi:hypothetical protein